MKKIILSGAIGMAALGYSNAAYAVEGGLSAYFLGSRDSLAGIVPGSGTYLSFDFISFSGSVNNISLGGFPVFAADIDTTLVKLSITHVFEASLWGGTPAVNLNIPYADADLTYKGPLANGIEDAESALGDFTVTPVVGWHSGFNHWSFGTSIFVPVGKYDSASVDIPNREINAVNIGKNVWAIQPVIAGTHLNTDTGREFSGAASLVISERNSATDYQTAPQLTLEGAALQHLPSGWAFGASGYYYQQLGDDSGTGAAQTRAALGTESLEARVFGIGPIVTFNGKLGNLPLSVKLKYTHEFEAKRRFESDVLWLNVGFSF